MSWSVPEVVISVWALPESKRGPVRKSTWLWIAVNLVYAGWIWFENPVVSVVMFMFAGAIWHFDRSLSTLRSGPDGDGRGDDGPNH